MSSKYLSSIQRQGLLKTGDVIVPGTKELPAFSELDPTPYFDNVFDYTPAADRKDFLLLMTIFGYLPKFLVRGFISIAFHNNWFPHPIGSLLRLMEIGIKGVILTLYYSHTEIHAKINWHTNINTKP